MAQAVEKNISLKLAVKWLATFAVPALLYFMLPIDEKELTHHMAMFLVITLWVVMIWAMDLINDVATGLMLPVLYMAFCAVPSKVVYGPWSSDVPNIVIGGFILCKILQETGLGKRIGLACMKAMGGSFMGTIWGIMIAAFIINPLVPAITGKAVIFCAIIVSLCESLDFQKQSREATALMLAGLVAVASSKNCFLTGGGDLVMGMQLVDNILQTKTSWLQYASWAFVPATVFAVLSVAVVAAVLPSKVKKEELRAALLVRYQELGPMKLSEKIAAGLMIFTLVMLVTDKLHGFGAGMTFILVAFISFLPKVGLMNADNLKKVNFTPLFFIMGCMAIGSAGNFLKVTNWLAGNLFVYIDSLSAYSAGVFGYLVGVVANFLLTPLAATASLTSPLVELGLELGVEPKIIYLAFQIGLDNYIFPYEFAVVLLFYSFGYIHFGSMVKVLAIRMIMAIPFLLAVAIPYWKWIM